MLQAQEADRFAEIGNKVAATRMHLLKTPTPPKLPNKMLSITTGKRNEFTPMNRLDTPDELQEQLVKKRKQYEPYLQNYAPLLPASRDVIPLTEFNWRIETGADTKIFQTCCREKAPGRKWPSRIMVRHSGKPSLTIKPKLIYPLLFSGKVPFLSGSGQWITRRKFLSTAVMLVRTKEPLHPLNLM
jgi:hypothetical protein